MFFVFFALFSFQEDIAGNGNHPGDVSSVIFFFSIFVHEYSSVGEKKYAWYFEDGWFSR